MKKVYNLYTFITVFAVFNLKYLIKTTFLCFKFIVSDCEFVICEIMTVITNQGQNQIH